MDIQENPFTEALLDDIEDGASCHFHPELEALMDDFGLEPIEDDDILPF